jgi:hypothetical protein
MKLAPFMLHIAVKESLLHDYRRFKQLQPVCSNLAVIYDTYIAARDEKVPY